MERQRIWPDAQVWDCIEVLEAQELAAMAWRYVDRLRAQDASALHLRDEQQWAARNSAAARERHQAYADRWLR